MIGNARVIFKVLMKCVGNCSVYVYCCEVFLVCLGELLLERNYTILELLFIGVFTFPNEESLELEIIYSTVTKGIDSDIFQKFSWEFFLFAKLKEMLYSWK